MDGGHVAMRVVRANHVRAMRWTRGEIREERLMLVAGQIDGLGRVPTIALDRGIGVKLEDGRMAFPASDPQQIGDRVAD